MVRTKPEKSTGGAKTDSVSCFYKNYENDVLDMKEQGFKSFRMSISWAHIFPDESGRENREGIEFYNRVINPLITNGIEPFVDILHSEMPMYLAEHTILLCHFRTVKIYREMNLGAK